MINISKSKYDKRWKPISNSNKITISKIIIILLIIAIKLFVLYKYTHILDNFKSTEYLIKEVINENDEAVVQILSYSNDTLLGNGSGVIYSKSDDVYYIVTNEHVIINSNKLQVRLYDKSVINAYVYKVDSINDLAVIKMSCDKKLTTLKAYSNGNNLTKGQIVVSIGTPMNDSYYNTATIGIISNLSTNLIQHSSPVNPGNSGGALFNLKGQLIGINTSKVMTTSSKNELVHIEGISIATNINLVNKLFD